MRLRGQMAVMGGGKAAMCLRGQMAVMGGGKAAMRHVGRWRIRSVASVPWLPCKGDERNPPRRPIASAAPLFASSAPAYLPPGVVRVMLRVRGVSIDVDNEGKMH